ncbi:MAG: hypothetical protein H6934_04380 [Burkholderiaceae bacterium]|nr:hypothetical protein [Burkholderiaceae bacterium]
MTNSPVAASDVRTVATLVLAVALVGGAVPAWAVKPNVGGLKTLDANAAGAALKRGHGKLPSPPSAPKPPSPPAPVAKPPVIYDALPDRRLATQPRAPGGNLQRLENALAPKRQAQKRPPPTPAPRVGAMKPPSAAPVRPPMPPQRVVRPTAVGAMPPPMMRQMPPARFGQPPAAMPHRMVRLGGPGAPRVRAPVAAPMPRASVPPVGSRPSAMKRAAKRAGTVVMGGTVVMLAAPYVIPLLVDER